MVIFTTFLALMAALLVISGIICALWVFAAARQEKRRARREWLALPPQARQARETCLKEGHAWAGCVCTCCGSENHDWQTRQEPLPSSCEDCGGTGIHWHFGQEYSCGCGSVDGFISVRREVCSRCGEVK